MHGHSCAMHLAEQKDVGELFPGFAGVALRRAAVHLPVVAVATVASETFGPFGPSGPVTEVAECVSEPELAPEPAPELGLAPVHGTALGFAFVPADLTFAAVDLLDD